MNLDEERLRILSEWHDGPHSPHRLVISLNFDDRHESTC